MFSRFIKIGARPGFRRAPPIPSGLVFAVGLRFLYILMVDALGLFFYKSIGTGDTQMRNGGE